MNPCIVDANVWLAFLVQEHVHHRPSRRWFDTLDRGDGGLCRVVHLTLLRLLCNPAIMSHGALSAPDAWSRVAELLEDERVEFLPEPPDLDSVLPGLLRYPVPTGNLINDAYLAAFAIASRRRLATWDRGFRQFRGLDVAPLDT